MLYSNRRIAVIACGLAAALFLLPAQGEGGLFDWLCPSSWSSAASSATTYAPPYTTQRVSLMPIVGATAACSPVSQTCYYTPQTTYRWTYSRMAFTSYRPVTSLDPCTGCTTTVLRPVTRTTLLPWLHREPVTTYRLTCADACAPSCAAACYPSCSSFCQPGSIVGTVQAPIGSSCSTGCVPITTVPGAAASSSTTTDPGYRVPTFKTEPSGDADNRSSQGTQEPDLRLKPSSQPDGNPASIKQPQLIHPGNKTASRPVEYAAYHSPIQVAASPGNTASNAPLDVGGWRASRD